MSAPAAGKRGQAPGAREEQLGKRLLDPTLDIQVKLRAAQEMKELVERELDYAQFIAHCLPAITSILNNGKISMLAQSPEHVRSLC